MEALIYCASWAASRLLALPRLWLLFEPDSNDMVTDKETKAAAGPALAAKPSIEKELGDAKATAQEIGIEVGHVAGLKGADKMFAYASASPISIDEEMNKRLVRKIDWHILPWLCLLYVLQYLDKGV